MKMDEMAANQLNGNIKALERAKAHRQGGPAGKPLP